MLSNNLLLLKKLFSCKHQTDRKTDNYNSRFLDLFVQICQIWFVTTALRAEQQQPPSGYTLIIWHTDPPFLHILILIPCMLLLADGEALSLKVNYHKPSKHIKT